MVQTRNLEYKQRLADIKNIPNPPQMNIMEPIQEFKKGLDSYGVSLKIDQNTGKITGLDFNRSSLRNNPVAQKDFNNVLDGLKNAFDDTKFYSTPEGFDILKRQMGDLYHETNQGRALTQQVKKSIRNQLGQKVYGYNEMEQGFSKMTETVNEIKQNLSMGEKSSTQAGINKLMSSLRDDNDFRRSLIEELDKMGKGDLLDKIAGIRMKGFIPTQHGGTQSVMGEILGAITLHSPKLLVGILPASPRIVGETLNALGKTIREYRKIVPEKIGGIGTEPLATNLIYQNLGLQNKMEK